MLYEVITEFLAGYLIEQSLSVDNMFVFVMIFGFVITSYSIHYTKLYEVESRKDLGG